MSTSGQRLEVAALSFCQSHWRRLLFSFYLAHWRQLLWSRVSPDGGFDPNYGARPMRKTIPSLIESRIAEWILGADTLPQSLAVSVVDDVVCIEEICDFNDNKTQ